MRCQTCGDETSPAFADCQRCGTPLDGRPTLSPGIATYSVRGIGLAAAIGLGLTTLLYVLLAAFPAVEAVLARRAATADDADALRSAAVAEGLLNVPYLLLYLTTAVLVMIWMFRARKNTDAFPGVRPHLNAHWAITGWWVPLASLVVPAKMMADIVRDSRGRGRGLVALWWLGWLVFGVADLFTSLRAARGQLLLPDPRTPADFQRYADHYQEVALGNLVPAVACLVAGVSLIVLVLRVSAAQQARIARGSAVWPGAPAWVAAPAASAPAPAPVTEPSPYAPTDVTEAPAHPSTDAPVASPPAVGAAGGTIGA
ncbi:DUF4328 domain-containing protein [Micromonospora sp. 4G57]|uniref:DUF4328 domain-containing protein n=1 Tax=Micromonospora sicca TaxID=2202420 RepID=A0ABU5JD56_9ACTN|nr:MULTISPECIES: DUF4328 domain-containing protein [unclassified Micromonospora]MDZ5442049.1 DUF4328 domain-containing protein [Micromonospora sp. 4G57]MDZ5490524.1 DUF4328 domain-containing protein [Micromonospora sp. 4G53]